MVETSYWYFSTVAQVIATILAVYGTAIIFRISSLKDRLDDSIENFINTNFFRDFLRDQKDVPKFSELLRSYNFDEFTIQVQPRTKHQFRGLEDPTFSKLAMSSVNFDEHILATKMIDFKNKMTHFSNLVLSKKSTAILFMINLISSLMVLIFTSFFSEPCSSTPFYY